MKQRKKKVSLNEDLTLNLQLPEEFDTLDPSQVDVNVVGAEDEMGMEDMPSDEEEVSLDDLEAGEEDMDLSPDEDETMEEMDDYSTPEEEDPRGMRREDEMYENSSSDDDIDSILEGLSDDDVIEIDENALKEELQKLQETDGPDASSLDDFGDGEVKGEPFTDTDDEDLNVLDEKKSEMKEARKLRALKRENAEYRKTTQKLRSQLAEMNLFSTKLLYVNKLLQKEGLSPGQKVKIVEALDNAETSREAKLLYRSLTESLEDKSLGTKPKGKTNIKESSARRHKLSSSSSKASKRSSASQETLNENNQGTAQVSRWAQLAGISENE